MSEKRKDSKGRILRTGESERKDGLYQFRYKDINGERRTIYERSLQDLRKKEKEIELQIAQGVSYFDGNIKLCDAMDKVFSLKRKWKDSTRRTMEKSRKLLVGHKIYNMPINKIRVVDCKEFFISLHDQGLSFGTISLAYCLIKMTMDIACESDALAKNPCSFSLKSIIDDDTPKVVALTAAQETSLLQFLKDDAVGRRHYDMFVILLGTGMRISEYAALTIKDIDFSQNTIRVNKQIARLKGGIQITTLKSEKSERNIPMTPEVKSSVLSLMERRRSIKQDVIIDGYVGFLSVTRSGRPRTHSEYADACRLLMNKYNSKSDTPIGRCTPHVLRHTFCTKCIAGGMDIKTVQYLMGHSNASTTLNIYTDEVRENVVSSMEKLVVYC